MSEVGDREKREHEKSTPRAKTVAPEGASYDSDDGRFSNYYQSLLDLHKSMGSIDERTRALGLSVAELRADVKDLRSDVKSLPSSGTIWAAVSIIITALIGLGAIAFNQ